MRLVVFFDLPVETPQQRKAYRLFHRFLTKEGYLMLQESVYAKLVTNENVAEAALAKMKKNKPSQGLVQVLRVTEKQFATMVYITGEQKDFEELGTTEEFVVI